MNFNLKLVYNVLRQVQGCEIWDVMCISSVHNFDLSYSKLKT